MMPTSINNNSDNPTNEGASTTSSPSTIHKRNTLQQIQWWSNFLFKGFAFVLCLLPGYCRLFYYYIISSDRVCVRYGEGARNYLDVYGSGSAAKSTSSSSSSSGSSSGGNNETTANNNNKKKKPVLIFICGGTWQIHQRYYAMALGKALSPLGILVIVPDYRPYTSSSSSKWKKKNDSNHHVSIREMIDDVDSSVEWVLKNVEEYGGDKERVMLVGQSAGGHLVGLLAALKMLDWVQQHCQQQRSCQQQRRQTAIGAAAGDNDEEQQQQPQSQPQRWLKSTYTPRQLIGYVPTAGPLNLIDIKAEYLNNGMMSPQKMSGLFGGQSNEALATWSPLQIMQRCYDEYSVMLQGEVELGQEGGGGDAKVKKQDGSGVVFPRICAIHGTGDTCVPVRTSEEFVKEMSSFADNIEVELITYDGWSHTDPIIEKPMEGDHTYHRDLYELMRKWTAGSSSTEEEGNVLPPFDESNPMLKPLCPSVMVGWARSCNPF